MVYLWRWCRKRGAGVRRVEFYYDLVSPYSYLAHGRIRRICAEHGVELALRPMLLGGSTRRSGSRPR